MATIDDRIDDLKDVVNEMNKRLTDVEKVVNKTREEKLASDLDFYKTLTETVNEAVSKAINPLIDKLENQNKRIIELENKSGKTAILLLKTATIAIITTTVGWIITGYLNNYATITSDAIRNNIKSQEVTTNENNNN